MSTDHHSGTEETRILNSAITLIEDNKLQYRGYAIDDLALKASFEEVVYLLWNGRLPGKIELENLKKEIRLNSSIPPEVQIYINHIPRNAHPQAVLRTLISSLAHYDEKADEINTETNRQISISILAKAPLLVAAFERHRRGKSPIAPDLTLDFAANFLFVFSGSQPDREDADALNRCLISYAEHELNASTFAARVTAGTMSDMYSGLSSSLATLKGSLHGGANQKAMETILDIDVVDAVEDYLAKKLNNKEKIMGFGHAVYKNGDPRCVILKDISKKLCEKYGYQKYFAIAEKMETTMLKTKKLHPNVDFYSALIFYALGFPIDMYTPIFSIARIAGWIAHIYEQYAENKMIRPRADYTGARDLKFVALEERS